MKSERFSFRPGEPPRVAVAWERNVLGRLRAVAVTLDGQPLVAEPRRADGRGAWIFHMPDGRALVTQGTAPPFSSESMNVYVDGRLLPSARWVSGGLARRGAVLLLVLACIEATLAGLALRAWPATPWRVSAVVALECALCLLCAAGLWKGRAGWAFVAACACLLGFARLPYFVLCLEAPLRAELARSFFVLGRLLRTPRTGAAAPP